MGEPAVPAWVIVTTVGLPFAPLAITVICPVRRIPLFSARRTLITPLFPPDAPVIMLNQSEPAEMLAAYCMVPPPVLLTVKFALPLAAGREVLAGFTVSSAACTTEIEQRASRTTPMVFFILIKRMTLNMDSAKSQPASMATVKRY